MASANVIPITSEVKIAASVSFKDLMEIKPDSNRKNPQDSSIDNDVPQEQSLNEKGPEANLSSPDVEVAMDDSSASDEAETDAELKKSISAISEMLDEKILMNEQSRPLTIEKFEKIEHEKRKQKKALKRLARQQLQLEVVNEDQLSSTDISLFDENDVAKASIITYDDLFLLQLESSSSISTSSSEESDTEVYPMAFNEDFLKSIAKVPDIDEISLVTQERTSVLEKVASGKFVNPLTGETSSTDLDETDLLEEIPYTEEGEPEVEDDSEVELSDIVLPEEDGDVVPPVAFCRYPEARGSRTEINFLPNIELSPVYSKSTSSVPEAKEVRISSFDVVQHFIEKLINTVVVKKTTKESMENLSAKLDKSKLINKLSDVWITLVVERTYNENIKARTVDYYRRVNKIWAITPQPIKLELMDYRRYKHLLNILDHLRQKAKSTQKKVMCTIDSIIFELQSAQYFSNRTADKLEDRMRKTIAPLESKELEQSLETDIKYMQDLRNQIGETRMQLLRQNHTLASFLEQLMHFDTIEQDLSMPSYIDAQDFSMTNYINTQHDILKLGKLLEGRTICFDHMHERFDNYIKRVAFYREKTDITAALLHEQKERLKELYSTRLKLRKRLQNLYLEHNRYKAEKNELDLKAGIFRSPYLMLDYDKCMEFVLEKRKVVLELRCKVQKMNSRLTKIFAHSQAVY